MDRMNTHGGRRRLACLPLAALPFSALLFATPPCGAAASESLLHTNEHAEIQMYSYPAGSSNGAGSVRDRAPTFGAFSGVDSETGQSVFFPGSGADPSRRGSFIVASDTSADVPAGLAPARYQVESLRVTATLLGNLIYEPLGYVLPYDNTLDDHLALTTGGGDDPGRPIEMYGIGLQGDFETISFAAAADEAALQLGDARWRQYREGEAGYDPELPAGEQAIAPYPYFAVDALGRDAENSVAGGYSATEPSGETEQFTPAPMAIGKLYDDEGAEFEPGDYMRSGDVFVFEPNLSDPGVLDYVRGALSEGWLGFSFSSLHEAAGHDNEGAVPYPDFYLDDLDVGDNPDGAAPTIELVVSILDPLPGDYDGDGQVTTSDYDRWVEQFGTTGPEADGNGNGLVDAADFTVWRDHYTPASQAIAVPEPSGAQVLLIALATGAFCGWQHWLVSGRRR
ncbi:hypothetical protein Mal64_09260 [Pseudobythopirellula maris]|uniref:EF-hand domain-containing protein n=1 Tax=Pseudobythopirellula maris TaxID=2527991 RepID=A0A5C5ZSL5_9BACT|nr:hypothetical protein [Pseudobythopirellula maris]TWT90534.1 hypothetical protein Mal64_09260 [Pseudobythopirellula maris]